MSACWKFSDVNSERCIVSILNRSLTVQDKKRSMDAGSKSGKGFTDEDDDDEELSRREGSSYKDLTVKIDRKSNQTNSDPKPTTPRSKHSATEQRRRSKINDRFQILRDIIPHSDQKRDKASFLLEVIEYVQFLQEKVQKYEPYYPGWVQENTKLTPWKNSQTVAERIADPSEALHNGPSAPGIGFSLDNTIPVAPLLPTNDHSHLESDNVNSGLAHKAASTLVSQQYGSSSGLQTHQMLVTDSVIVAPHLQSKYSRQHSGSGNDLLSEQDLTIDEGTISVSSAYSQGLLNALAEALENSGIDLSQASISVQMNLGKRAFSRSVANPNGHEDPLSTNQAVSNSQMVGTIEEPEQCNKRRKPDES